MLSNDTASAPPGLPNDIEGGETKASAPLGPDAKFNGNHATASAPPSYSEVDSGNDSSKRRAPPPVYNERSGLIQAIAAENIKADRLPKAQPQVNLAPADSKDCYFLMNDDELEEAEGPREGPGWMSACRRSTHLKSWILTVAIVCFLIILLLVLVGTIHIGRTGMIVAVCITAFLYLLEMFCSSSFSYLTQTHEKDTVEVIVNRMKAATPSVKWHVQCYHYETRVHTSTDKDGNTTTRTSQERVNTWRATGYFQFVSWSDISAPLVGMDQYRLTKLKLKKRFAFDNNSTQAEFQRQKIYFRQSNNRDVHMDFTETFIVPGFKSRILCEAVEGYRPFCLNLRFYLLFHLIFLGPCYRWWFSSICGNKSLDIVKVLSCNSGVTGAV